MNTEEMEFWKGSFGSEYTERSTLSVEEQDQVYIDLYGISRTELNQQFLYNLSIGSILEVGCNVANQLRCLQKMGYTNLYGIELQSYAVEKAKQLTSGINIVQGSAFDLPFKDSYFDLVFTAGVLIHLAPADINKALDEIYRVSGKYIWGFEYFSENYLEIEYRSHQGKLWKADFKQLFMNRFPDLRLVKCDDYKYVDNDNMDQMYLLEKV